MRVDDVYQIRTLTLGELLDEAYLLFRHTWLKLVAFQLIVFVPTAMVEVYVIRSVGRWVMAYLSATDYADPWGLNPMLFMASGLLVVLLIQMIMAPVIGAVLTQAVADSYLSKNWGLQRLIETFLRYAKSAFVMGMVLTLVWLVCTVLPLIMAGSLAFWAVQSGLIAGLPVLLLLAVLGLVFGLPAMFAGLYVNLRFMLSFNALVLEDMDIWSSFRRSSTLMRNRYWQGFSLWLVLFLIAILLGLVATAFVPTPSFELLEPDRIREIFPQLVEAQVMSTVLGEFMGMFSRTFVVIAWTLFYFSIRCRDEGFDILILSARFSKRS
jgi:hypothetical protein